MTEPPAKRECIGVDCENESGSLQCPTCLKLGIKDSYFCSQDCFKRSWVSAAFHLHYSKASSLELGGAKGDQLVNFHIAEYTQEHT